jgi:hypothetical protein
MGRIGKLLTVFTGLTMLASTIGCSNSLDSKPKAGDVDIEVGHRVIPFTRIIDTMDNLLTPGIGGRLDEVRAEYPNHEIEPRTMSIGDDSYVLGFNVSGNDTFEVVTKTEWKESEMGNVYPSNGISSRTLTSEVINFEGRLNYIISGSDEDPDYTPLTESNGPFIIVDVPDVDLDAKLNARLSEVNSRHLDVKFSTIPLRNRSGSIDGNKVNGIQLAVSPYGGYTGMEDDAAYIGTGEGFAHNYPVVSEGIGLIGN